MAKAQKSTAAAPTLNLADLEQGLPALTAAAGTTLGQAASCCLHQEHSSPVQLAVGGHRKRMFELHWVAPTGQVLRTHADPEDATRDGATGIAILLVTRVTPYTIIEKSRKGTGFDYWLGHEGDLLFQRKARLEISGILRGTPPNISARVKRKQNQTKQSDATRLPAHVVVIEFSEPFAHHTVRK